MNQLKWLIGLSSLSIVMGAAGCGGGGGGQSANNAGRAAVPVFVTDSPDTDNDHVWATIVKVEVLNATGTSVTVFEDSIGQSIDVKTLRDASGQRFAFLSNGSLAAGTYTSIRVTIGSSITIFPRSAGTGRTLPIDDSIARDSQGHAVITFPLTAPRDLSSGADDIVIDFDLAHFVLANGKIKPSLREGDHTGLHDTKRHEGEDHQGTLSNLSGAAPSFTFTLQMGGTNVTVITDASTVLFKSDANTNPTLANGQTVEVTGVFDPGANRIAATSVRIEDVQQNAARATVEGAPSGGNASAGTLSVTALQVNGFVPSETSVKIVSDSTTVFRNGGVIVTAAEFFALLATTQDAKFEGTYDSGSNTLTAARARIIVTTGGHESHDAEVRGTAVMLDSVAKTFAIDPVTVFDGFELVGHGINIATTSTTEFRSHGAVVTPAEFFAALTPPQVVRADGTVTNGTLTATSVRVENGGNNNH